jgi:hypothetical protein
MLPHFPLTRSMLVDVGLRLDGDEKFHLHNETIGWVSVKQGYVVTVDGGNHIFIKALDIKSDACPHFDAQLRASQTNKQPHLRKQLPRSRERVRQKDHQAAMSAMFHNRGSQESTPTSSSEDHPGTVVPRKRKANYIASSHHHRHSPLRHPRPRRSPSPYSSSTMDTRHMQPTQAKGFRSSRSSTYAVRTGKGKSRASSRSTSRSSSVEVSEITNQRPIARKVTTSSLSSSTLGLCRSVSSSASSIRSDTPVKLENIDDVRALFRATVVSSIGCTPDEPIDVDSVINAEKDMFVSDGDDEPFGRVIDAEEDVFASDGVNEEFDDYVSWTLDVKMHGGETEAPSVDGAREEDEMAEEVVKQWPSDFHAVDIVKGFAYCTHAVKSKKRTLKAAFEDFFPTTFAGSTYNEHRHRWMDSPQVEKDKALAARHSLAGLWSEFMKNNPARHAQMKKEKQKLRAARRRRNESESGDESP